MKKIKSVKEQMEVTDLSKLPNMSVSNKQYERVLENARDHRIKNDGKIILNDGTEEIYLEGKLQE